MIESMTGFGKSEWTFEGKKMQVEIRSLNSKNLDLNIRIPNYLKEQELELRNRAAAKLKRGKVDVFFNLEKSESAASEEVNAERIRAYMQQLQSIAPDLSADTLLNNAMRMPDVLLSKKEELSQSEWQEILRGYDEALDKIANYRNQEGALLKKDFLERTQTILELLDEVPAFEQERKDALRQRLAKNREQLSVDLDENRLEQEILYYLEKLDITEEKVRLKANCDYFLEMLETQDSNGKKLGFICQEIGREINTLGSKSNHAGMQRIVVQMKDELEKIKEQILNVL